MKNNEKEVKKILDLLNKKKGLLEELLNLSRYYAEFCQQNKLDKLNRLIRSQRLRVDKLKEIDKKAEAISRNLKDFHEISGLIKPDINKDILSQLAAKKEEINNLLVEIHKINQNNQDIVWSKYQKLKEKIITINRARKVRKVYKKGPFKSIGFFVDRRENTGYKKRRFS